MIYINGRFLTQRLTGVQRYAFEITKRLTAHYQNNLCILIPNVSINHSYETKNLPVKVIGKITNTLWEQIDLPIYLQQKDKPLLINLVNTAPCFYKNQIVCIMDMTIYVNPKWFSKYFVFYYKIIVPQISKNSKKVITISESSKKDIVQYLQISAEKIEIISPAVSDKFYKHNIGSNILVKLNLNHNQYILSVSSLDPRKNFKRLIEAYNFLHKEIPLVIVGSEGKVFADEGLKIMLKEKNIIFTGYVNDDDLITLYSSAKFFVYPSLYEGFGIPPLEAMACGCATIVSNTSSLPEVCDNASLYVNPTDTQSINIAIQQLLKNDDLRNQLIARGKEQVKKFSWDISARKLISVIEKQQQKRNDNSNSS
ncbi:MAG: glycosyltransferase family 1 protein [Chitinophagaceae bacterium]